MSHEETPPDAGVTLAPPSTFLQKPMSLQNALIVALSSALAGSAGTGGLSSIFGGGGEEVAQLQAEVRELQVEIHDLHGIVTRMSNQVDQTHSIVEDAHPRFPTRQ